MKVTNMQKPETCKHDNKPDHHIKWKELVVDRFNRDCKWKHLYQLYNVAGVIRNESKLEGLAQCITEHGAEFEEYSKRSWSDFVESIEIVENSIGQLKSIILKSL
jgi:hypothetical protein